MPTIADALNSNNPAATATDAGTSGGVGTTNRLRQILQQTSGKAAAPGGPAAQNFAEQSGVAGAAQSADVAQGQQTLQTGQLANSAAAQAAQAANSTAASNQKFVAEADQYANRASQLLQQFEQGGQQVNLERNQLSANQLAFTMRLSSEKYTARLSEEGQLRRLNDAVSFQEQTAQAVMGAEMQALGDHLTFEDVMTTSEDQWQQMLGGISIDDSITLAKLQNKGAAAAQAFSAIPTAVAGVAKIESAPDSNAETRASNQSQPNFVGPAAPAGAGSNS